MGTTNGRLAGKIAVITGGGGDIGRTAAAICAQQGAAVVVADLVADTGEAVAASIRADGGDATFMAVDIREPGSFDDLVRQVLSRHGRIDLLHNNAAATHLYAPDTDVLTIDVQVWNEIITTNLTGVMLACKAALRPMIEQGSGSIINMSSTRSVAGAADLVAYGTSKAAVEALTRYIASAHGLQGVRCNAIRPGPLETSRTAQLHAGGGSVSASFAHHLLTPTVGTPVDIAHAVVYLGSDESGYVNGQVLAIDGGLLAHQPFLGDSRRAAPAPS